MPKATDLTSVTLSELMPQLLRKLEKCVEDRGCVILQQWPLIIGEKLAPMTQATAFREGVLYVKVKNAISYSLLAQYEKNNLLKVLRERFPKVEIRNIIFRMG